MCTGRTAMTDASTVVATGSRRASPLLTRGSVGMLETLRSIRSARTGLVGTRLLAAPSGMRRHRNRLRQTAGQAVIDDQHVPELRQIDKRLDPRRAVLKAGHQAHRQSG